MGREKEKFWEYVEDLNGRFLCKFCEHRFSGGITRIKSHLSGLKGRDIEICMKVPEDVQFAALQAIGADHNKRAKSSRTLNNVVETESFHQPTVMGVSNKDKSVMLDRILAKFAISNQISVQLSGRAYLVDLLKSIAEFGPSYELPSYSALGSELIPDIYKEAEEYVRSVHELLITTGCTLVIYNVVRNSRLVCINTFAYTPAGVVYLKNIVVPDDGLSFRDFIDSIYCIIESLGPGNVVQCIINYTEDHILDIITDLIDQNFFMSVQAMIHRKFPWIYLARCASHEFRLLLTLTYIAVPWIHKTTQLARVIFRYLYEHEISILPRREHARNKEYDCGLKKFAVEFFALNSILEVDNELQALQLPTSEDDVAEIVDRTINSTEFWNRAKKVVRILQPLFQVLDFIDGDGSTSGYLYEAMKKAEVAIEQQCDDDDDDRVHYEAIKKVFKEWRSRVVHPIHAAAAFLNPAYFCSVNFTEDNAMQNGLHILTLLLPVEEQEDFSKQLQLYRMKIPDLFTDTAMKMLKTIHPRKWWECFGDHYRMLQKYAIRILSQTCATPSCVKFIFQPDDSIDEMRMKVIMMENSSILKSQNLELIDLDRNSGLPEYSPEYVVYKNSEKVDRPNGVDYHDLLTINNPDARLLSQSVSNADDTMLKFSNQNGKWWECFGDPCPILQKLAVRILSQPCSAPLFPKTLHFQPNGRVDELRMNTILMENFGTVKSQQSEPIHFNSEDPDYAYEDVSKFLEWNRPITRIIR
ncbi:hypothetical protein QYF36_017318 [Acer negundo]|nr:hypothetical protein QYF36_017318 [Acer negundo]